MDGYRQSQNGGGPPQSKTLPRQRKLLRFMIPMHAKSEMRLLMKIHHLILWTIAATLSVQPIRSEPALATNEVVKANNAFAFDLYKHLAKEPGNLVVSPFSIDTALTMAYAGARGNTASQMGNPI
jgi:hypothetical protein